MDEKVPHTLDGTSDEQRRLLLRPQLPHYPLLKPHYRPKQDHQLRVAVDRNTVHPGRGSRAAEVACAGDVLVDRNGRSVVEEAHGAAAALVAAAMAWFPYIASIALVVQPHRSVSEIEM